MNTLGGELLSHLTTVVLLTLLIAPLVLWRYRRAVLGGMMSRPGPTLPVAPPTAPPAAAASATDAAPDLRWERRLQRRLYFAVLAAAGIAALPVSALYLHLGDLPLTPAHLYLKAAALGCIVVPVHAVLCALSWRHTLGLAIGTLLGLAACGVVLSMLQRPFLGKAPSLDQAMNFLVFLQFAALTLWLPLLLGLAAGARRVRGVAPIVLAGLLVFGLAPLLGARLTQWLTGTRAGAEWVLSGPQLEAGFIIVALPVGLLAWWRLRSLARGYEAKRFSDAQLLARTWWLLLVALGAIELISSRGAAAALPVAVASMLSVALFGPLLGLALRRAVAGPRPPARTLLVLRVFGDTARSEALFDRLVARWRWFGPVTMIAAPDVVARTVDPGDFLRFAAGDIASTFVTTPADLEHRLATLDTTADPDGRYRVNEFCCRDSSWQATVVQLIERADAVVMDLRGYGAQRAGCAFELGELARRRRPGQVVLLVDASTDRQHLATLRSAAGATPALVEMPHRGRHAFDQAFDALLCAAHGAGVREAEAHTAATSCRTPTVWRE